MRYTCTAVYRSILYFLSNTTPRPCMVWCLEVREFNRHPPTPTHPTHQNHPTHPTHPSTYPPTHPPTHPPINLPNYPGHQSRPNARFISCAPYIRTSKPNMYVAAGHGRSALPLPRGRPRRYPHDGPLQPGRNLHPNMRRAGTMKKKRAECVRVCACCLLLAPVYDNVKYSFLACFVLHTLHAFGRCPSC